MKDEEVAETQTAPETENKAVVENTAPVTEPEYQKAAAEITLDRAKAVLMRMTKMHEVEQIDFLIAQLDAARANLDHRRVLTLIGDTEEKAEE